LFATLAGRFISVAAKGLEARVGSDPDTILEKLGAGGISAPRLMWSFDGQWAVVSEEKNSGRKREGDKPFSDQGERARMGCDKHGRE